MASLRTQIYLTREQRAKLDAVRRRDGRSLAQVIRDAIDAYLSELSTDAEASMAETFGIDPDFSVPSRDEWRSRPYG